MNKSGPSVTNLMHRLSEIKNIFLEEPEMKVVGHKKNKNTNLIHTDLIDTVLIDTDLINTRAVVSDLLFNTGGRFITDEEAGRFAEKPC